MYICIHIYIYKRVRRSRIDTYICIHTTTLPNTTARAIVYTYVYVNMYIHEYIYKYVYLHVYIYTYIYIHIYIYTRVCVDPVYIRTY